MSTTTAFVCDIPTVIAVPSPRERSAGGCEWCSNCQHSSGSGEWLKPLIAESPLLRPEPYSVAHERETRSIAEEMGVCL